VLGRCAARRSNRQVLLSTITVPLSTHVVKGRQRDAHHPPAAPRIGAEPRPGTDWYREAMSAGPDLEFERAKVASYRRRLMAGLAASIGEKGLSATTIADIVRHAGMSKRAFYDQFTDKDECFLALYQSASERVIAAIDDALAQDAGSREERLRNGIHVFLSMLEGEQSVTRAHFIEIYSLGERGLQARNAVLARYAEAFMSALARSSVGEATVSPLSPHLAIAFIGGVDELALRAIQEGRTDQLLELSDAIVEFANRVLINPCS
jgi:AcrR family transcriptional regulator